MNNTRNNRFQNHTERGAALITFVIFFLLASTILVIGIGRGVYQSLSETRMLQDGKQSFYAAEAGIEDAVYRLRDAKSYSSTESFTFNGSVVNTARVLNIDVYEITATANTNGSVRRSFVELAVGDGASFNFGLQAGNGGVFMENNSTILGNVFANGTVEGANNNIVYGDIVSAGPAGLADGVHATGSVWAHRIESSLVDRDAYYQTIVGTIVNGNSFPGSPDQATATLPISDTQIEDWKADAVASSVIASTSPQCSGGTYIISSDITLNPVKIDCNLTIQGNSTDVYLKGSVWVSGDIIIKNTATLRVHASSTGRSVSIIADKTTDRLTSSKITLENNSVFVGNGTNSYIFLISQNNSSELGGSEVAINMKNNSTGALLLYAAHGEILVENGSGIKSVTGYQIHTKNNTQIVYESGLVSILFTSGPGGGYTISDWNEV
jgi:Tfp pilus assembly protein PilX